LFVFVSGESFWRGYILFGLYRHIGYLAIPVMVIPYVMVHFGKPWPETFGAILTGCVLGFLAIRHRSFWLGVAVHYAAAISMDLLAIHQRGLVFTW
ncbi:MAG TPA: CPBP family intramembrane metalloprotease, partial [Myxococcota bacterium]|nr:CPBP family intramembrane metalloprotease [Myxococcota bacterium]